MDEAPYHAGEQAIQERFGLREKMDRIGRRVIRDFMPDEHRDFFDHQPWLLIGSVDDGGRPWASTIVGDPGFVSSPDARTLVIATSPLRGDVLSANLVAGAPIGALGIELHTRRRNRLNGTIASLARNRIEISVDQSFGNCPKYINRKLFEPRVLDRERSPASALVSDRLTPRAQEIIAAADVLFIASSFVPTTGKNRSHGVDVSHRGGPPGFVRLEPDGSLTIPDYVGNFAFNTLGNIDKDRRCGLLFIDFASGDLLQLTAAAWIDWDAPEIRTTAGVQRLVRAQPEEVRLLPACFPLGAATIDYSPNLTDIESIAGR
jgi:uncharacterized protein